VPLTPPPVAYKVILAVISIVTVVVFVVVVVVFVGVVVVVVAFVVFVAVFVVVGTLNMTYMTSSGPLCYRKTGPKIVQILVLIIN